MNGHISANLVQFDDTRGPILPLMSSNCTKFALICQKFAGDNTPGPHNCGGAKSLPNPIPLVDGLSTFSELRRQLIHRSFALLYSPARKAVM